MNFKALALTALVTFGAATPALAECEGKRFARHLNNRIDAAMSVMMSAPKGSAARCEALREFQSALQAGISSSYIEDSTKTNWGSNKVKAQLDYSSTCMTTRQL